MPDLTREEDAMDPFRGKTALISGGSRGIGFATAAALVARGCDVVISARGETRLEDSRRKLEAMGGRAIAVAGDVGDPDVALRMVRAALDRFGRLDIVINNAGISMRGAFADLTAETCERILRTNLAGPVLLTLAAANPVIEAHGSIVFVSSIAGLMGLPGASIYCATKGALTGLAESLRLELIPKGVHVGVAYVGYTEHDPEKRLLAADGSLLPPDRPAHATQASAAAAILKLIERRRRSVVMTPVGRIAAIVHRLSPGLVERTVLRAQAARWGAFRKFQ
jgi:NAD(P)-dependent dehydrogenase (short-subunit alcohol dehydrogenase family)